MKMTYMPVENFKGYVSSRPPVVLFVACLVVMSIAFISISYYIKDNDRIKDPEQEQDWNTFLERVSNIEFCLQGSDYTATSSPTTSTESPETTSEIDGEIHSVTTITPLKNYSLPLKLTMQPTPEFVRIPHNVTHLNGQIYGFQLGLKGKQDKEAVNVTFELPYEWKTTECPNGKCKPVEFLTCVHFEAPADMFPNTPKEPDYCQVTNETGVDYYSYMDAYKSMYRPSSCKTKPKIKVKYELEPGLTIYLSLRDTNAINLHLMHTSTFLFVMVIILICYAIVRGRSKQRNADRDTTLA